jgi:hypothetical protein
VSLSLLFGEEETGRFYYVLGTYSTPGNLSRILAGGNADVLAVYDEEALLQVVVNGSVELAMHGVVLEHISHVVNGKEVVDSNYLDVIALGGCTEYEPADAAKSIDTYFCHNLKINWIYF